MGCGKLWDLIIKNGFLIDGTGSPGSPNDIGILGDRIERVDRNLSVCARQVIDAEGYVVCPGFVDLHNHTEMAALVYPQCESHIMQGITTSVVGNCGLSMTPKEPGSLDLLRQYVGPFIPRTFDYKWDWRNFFDYYLQIETRGISMNMAPLAAQGNIRLAVKGFEPGDAGESEMNRMIGLLKDALDGGAWGMSTGLIYPPGSYAGTSELTRLARVAADFGGIYSTHLRNEGDRLMESLDEAILIGRESGIRVEVSHHKATGRHNWGKVNATLREMERARTQGVDISCDCYPYTASSTTLTACLPPWTMVGGVNAMLERLKDAGCRRRIVREIRENSVEMENTIKGSGWDGILIASCPRNHEFDGKSLAHVLTGLYPGGDFYEAFLDFLVAIEGEASMVSFSMDEDDLRTVMAHRLSSIISDAWLTRHDAVEKPHPRSYGSMPRLLGKYVREQGILTLEDAIRKITSRPASLVGLPDRGLVKEGFAADIVIFDPNRISDEATYQTPNRYPSGINYVIVNGTVTVDHGRHTGALNGRILRKRRDR